MQEYHKYFYEGPVMEFDTCIAQKWVGETTAPSESKAKSNLAFQFKKETGKSARTRITLPGKIKMVD